ncbi:DUF952 domain-containing protein [Streptomyces sp. NBC_00053]|uniref:DUF952 domain-containing protein n=1 Tax=Streptomyces sanglieri TaxID=193460 RepID=A0ABW2WUV2_9ACTN|nr:MULTISPECIES: DUF952 domain-containing protein [unclassified Streptomyces]WSG53292.1 DUF952 domain-containing protein [Streptomyces sp. NBC_01732]WSX03944.1 DUF952 domain-containing protein [Streptomyces sp. NBC_00987]MCX5105966.1 DUF952 domain-containing protein [Streptomyces sp. NBC_00439]MCX5162891.1 DUF952 domain-containing protein [Streptomyces sp. NBC_00305]MCX5221408.1 DUF952 domain-containing protein [Streptomyces sp. NBC_00264]
MAELLLHLTEGPLWEAARGIGTYEMSTRGRTLHEEGFIHCSLPHQLPGVAEMLYGAGSGAGTGDQELVVLVIDPDRLPVPVRYESLAPGGEEFPHIYGPVPVDAVVEVRPWLRKEGDSA